MGSGGSKKMPSYKLTYFDARARGEVIRMLFAAAKKPFEDVRVQFAEWPALKPKTPLGGMPVLEIDGKQFVQGMAISTFLAREFGLFGANNMEGLIIDMLNQTREDLLVEEAKVAFAKDDASRAEQQKKLADELYPKIFGFMNKVVKENKTGFAVGKKLSLGDIIIHVGTETANMNSPALLDSYPELKAVRAKVEAADGIKQYLAKRKVSPM